MYTSNQAFCDFVEIRYVLHPCHFIFTNYCTTCIQSELGTLVFQSLYIIHIPNTVFSGSRRFIAPFIVVPFDSAPFIAGTVHSRHV